MLIFAAPLVLLLPLLFTEGRTFTSRGVPIRLDILFLTYPLGAATAGAILGFQQPRMRSLSAAFGYGTVAVIPLVLGTILPLSAAQGAWRSIDSLLLVLGSVLLGPALGYRAWPGATRKTDATFRQGIVAYLTALFVLLVVWIALDGLMS